MDIYVFFFFRVYNSEWEIDNLIIIIVLCFGFFKVLWVFIVKVVVVSFRI